MNTPTITVFDTPEEEVPACARWLDATYPNWASVVDPDTLNMARGDYCIGGQTRIGWLQLTELWANASGQNTEHVEVFATYTDLWRNEILARQGYPQ